MTSIQPGKKPGIESTYTQQPKVGETSEQTGQMPNAKVKKGGFKAKVGRQITKIKKFILKPFKKIGNLILKYQERQQKSDRVNDNFYQPGGTGRCAIIKPNIETQETPKAKTQTSLEKLLNDEKLTKTGFDGYSKTELFKKLGYIKEKIDIDGHAENRISEDTYTGLENTLLAPHFDIKDGHTIIRFINQDMKRLGTTTDTAQEINKTIRTSLPQ